MAALKPWRPPIASSLDNLRALTWLAALMDASQLESPNQIERVIRVQLGLDPDKTGNVRAMSRRAGTLPFRKGSGPRLRSTDWPSRAEKAQQCWRGTLSWVTTPFWYLMEERPDLAVLTECVQLLPESLQEDLIEPAFDGSEPRLSYVARPIILELSLYVSPMGLGALACAMRRASISGEAGVERLCAVAIAWMLMALQSQPGSRLRLPLDHLLNWFLLQMAQYVYAPGLCAPLAARDIERFARDREEHASWTVERELAKLTESTLSGDTRSPAT